MTNASARFAANLASSSSDVRSSIGCFLRFMPALHISESKRKRSQIARFSQPKCRGQPKLICLSPANLVQSDSRRKSKMTNELRTAALRRYHDAFDASQYNTIAQQLASNLNAEREEKRVIDGM